MAINLEVLGLWFFAEIAIAASLTRYFVYGWRLSTRTVERGPQLWLQQNCQAADNSSYLHCTKYREPISRGPSHSRDNEVAVRESATRAGAGGVPNSSANEGNSDYKKLGAARDSMFNQTGNIN